MKPSVAQLCSFPIKGLSAREHAAVTLTQGEGLPGDRMFGFARANSGFDPDNPAPLPKDRFLVLARDPDLAALQTEFDAATQSLTITDPDGVTHKFDLTTPVDQAGAVDLLMRHLDMDPSKRAFLAHAFPHRFTDVSVVSPQMMNAVSLLNLSSVRAFGTDIGTDLDPARFRANISIEGWPAFCELDAVGQEIEIGGVRLRILMRTQRCAATEVNPVTATRDVAVPRLLRQTYGHMDMGVYAEILSAGDIHVGDRVSMLAI